MGQGTKTLSEISHLFLSNVREKAAPSRPTRTPPMQSQAPARRSVDLTPEEFQEVVATSRTVATEDAVRVPPIKAVIASHLGACQLDAIAQYAASIAESGKRVGLIYADAAEFQLTTFLAGEDGIEAEETTVFDPRAMRDAMNELSCDLDLWLLAVGNPRLAEARALLRSVGHWVLLSACDQEGVVASYRALKGLEELSHPRLGIAPIDAASPAESEAVFRKLASVCGQFLAWAAEPEPAVGQPQGVGECQVMVCRTSHDKAQLATGAQWIVIEELLEQARRTPLIEPPPHEPTEMEEEMPEMKPSPRLAAIEEPAPGQPAVAAPEPSPIPMVLPARADADADEVVDLPDGEASILSAVLKQALCGLVECPVTPPSCPGAKLAVSRDRRLVLVAEAGSEMRQLNAIARAYQWVQENRSLLGMALPQFALDIHQMPQVRLVAEHGVWSPDLLASLFQSGTVTVQTYRRLRWGQRLGLLLEAA